MQQDTLVDVLPAELQAEVLHNVQWHARRTCHAFRHHLDATLSNLRLRWPAHRASVAPADLNALLARLPQLRSINAVDCLASCVGLVARPHLTLLDLSNSPDVADLVPLSACTAMESLALNGCRGVADISALVACESLTSLNLLNCSLVADISSLSALTRLTSLILSRCLRVRELSAITTCTALRALHLHSCNTVGSIDFLPTSCPSLTTLDLGSCTVASIGAVALLTALCTLDLSSCGTEEGITPWASCPALTHLNLARHQALTDLGSLSTCTCLTWLDLTEVDRLTDVRPLATLKLLASLVVTGLTSDAVDDAPWTSCPALTSLLLDGHERLTSLASLAAACPQLRTLNVENCPNLWDIGALSTLSCLTDLDMNSCSAHVDLTPLGACPLLATLLVCWTRQGGPGSIHPLGLCASLTKLTVENGGADVSALAGCSLLQSLYLIQTERTQGLADLGPLARLPLLTELDLCRTDNLPSLVHSTGLRRLSVIGLQGVNSLAPLAACVALASFCLHHGDDLTDISALASCKLLTGLGLHGCPALSDVSPLGACTSLTTLTLEHCPKVLDVGVLSACACLRRLCIEDCTGIHDISCIRGRVGLRVYFDDDGSEDFED